MFVTGGAGFLGRRVVALAHEAGWRVVAPTSTEVDVRDVDAVTREIAACGADAVAHLAYRKDDAGVIVDGSSAVARAASAQGARLVHVSTDLVFAGRSSPYTEDDAPCPVNGYGRAKAAAERAVASIDPRAVLVRTSLLYATDELAPCQTMVVDALTGRSNVQFFTDEVRCPTHVEDLARAVVQLAGRPGVHGPLHVAASRPLDRATFARSTAAWLGLHPDTVPTSSIAASGLDRPARLVLAGDRARALGFGCRDVAEAYTAPPPVTW